MTLGDFLNYVAENPYYTIFYFFALPFAAFLANIFGKGEGHLSPWCNFYSALIYLVTIPGIFAIVLTMYHFLFERQSIYEPNLYAQVLPIISMALTFYLIKKNVDYKDIPGFGKLVNLLGIIAGFMVIFFFLEKMHIIALTYIPFIWFVLALIILFVAVRFGAKKLLKG